MSTLPNPADITVDHVPETVLFLGDEIERIFGRQDDGRAPPLFRPMWEYPGRKNHSYVFMTRELLNLLFIAIRAAQSARPEQTAGIARLLVDCHFMVHRLAGELPDHPVTAEMDLRAFNNPANAVHNRSGVFDGSHGIGYRSGADPETMDRLRQLNELSFESARRRLAENGTLPGLPAGRSSTAPFSHPSSTTFPGRPS